MKKNLIFLLSAAVALTSCNGGFKKGDAGLLYNIHIDNSGPKIKEGDFVVFNLIIKTDADSLLVNTYDGGRAVEQVAQKPQAKNDPYAAMQLLTAGDSATFKVSMDSVFKKSPRPPAFKGKYIIYVMKIDKVIPKGTLSDQVFRGRIDDYMKTKVATYQKAEPIQIKKYIADHKLTTSTTPDGLNYIITQPGTGDKPAVGDTVEVNYTLRYLTGKVIETNIIDSAKKYKKYNANIQYKPIKIDIGAQGLIPGWSEGMQLLNKGAKATLIIPSSLAYGERGSQAIGPFTPLLFDLQLVNFVHPNPNAPKPVAPQFHFPVPPKK